MFDFLIKAVSKYQFGNKEAHINNQNTTSTIAVVGTNSTDICTHEEADTRLLINLLDEAEKTMKNIVIWTVNSDILTIVLG